MNVRGRIDKLEDRLIGELVTVTLKGGGTATLYANRMYDIFLDALKGFDTPEIRIALAAESSNEDGGMLILLQALLASRDLAKKESQGLVQ